MREAVRALFRRRRTDGARRAGRRHGRARRLRVPLGRRRGAGRPAHPRRRRSARRSSRPSCSIRAWWPNGLPQAFNADWWLDPSRGGGILNAAGVHVIDRFRSWFGEVEAVSGQLGHTSPTSRGRRRGHLHRKPAVRLRMPRDAAALRRLPGARACGSAGSSATPAPSGWTAGAVHLADADGDRVVDVAARSRTARRRPRRAPTRARCSPGSSCRRTPAWPNDCAI